MSWVQVLLDLRKAFWEQHCPFWDAVQNMGCYVFPPDLENTSCYMSYDELLALAHNYSHHQWAKQPTITYLSLDN